MSQVLEKPILLDETGQAIAGKLDTNSAAIVDALDDIKDAIGTSSEFIPVMIKIITPPTKTAYKAGETLDLTGIVVNLVGTNGVQIDVTQACVFSPANGATLTSANTSVSISYHYAAGNLDFSTSQAITVSELSSIAVTTPPTTTDYSVGDVLDLTGMVVTATYSDGTTANVTNDCTYSPANGATLTSSDTNISVSYTEAGITKTTSQIISVKELTSIAITTPPTTTEYIAGDSLDLTGIVVTATYDDSSTMDVTDHCVYNPINGTILTENNTAITVSYTKGGTTKTASQPIHVAAVYGVEYDCTGTAWSRTGSAAYFTDPIPYYSGMTETPSSPFDSIQPWAGMQVINDAYAGKVVSIPKFYYKLSQQDASKDLKIEIANEPINGFSVSPAHMDRGDGKGERDVVYVGRYYCASNSFQSVSGQTPKGQYQKANFRSSIHGLGTDIWMMDFSVLFTLYLLYLVEYADWDSQKVIGAGGNTVDQYTPQRMGYTDSMPYHTGTMQTSRSTQGLGIQYRNIEGLWENVNCHIEGIRSTNYSGLYVIVNPSSYSDTSGGVLIGRPAANDSAASGTGASNFAISNETGAFPVFYPAADKGSGGMPDEYLVGNTNNNFIYLCSGSDVSSYAGLFRFVKALTSAYPSTYGARLMKLPANS